MNDYRKTAQPAIIDGTGWYGWCSIKAGRRLTQLSHPTRQVSRKPSPAPRSPALPVSSASVSEDYLRLACWGCSGQVFVGELAVLRIRSCDYSVGPASAKTGDRR